MRKFLAVVWISLVLPIVMVTAACGVKNKAEESSSNDEKEPSAIYYTVFFDSLGGTEIPEQKVESGKNVQKPKDPFKSAEERKEYVFLGWYLGEELWDFENMSVTENLMLTARYKVIAYSQEVLPSE